MVGTKPSPRLDVDLSAIWARIEAAGPRRGARAPSFPDVWDDGDDADERTRAQYDRRRTFIAFYGYAVPTREAIGEVARFLDGRSVIEVCAGAGLWASLLSGAGVDIVATDALLPRGAPYFPIAVLEAEAAVRAHPECGGLLLCWPPEGQSSAFRALSAFAGERVVYAGDVRFTATEEFHALLAREWQMQDRLRLPSWPGLDDAVHLYTRTQERSALGPWA